MNDENTERLLRAGPGLYSLRGSENDYHKRQPFCLFGFECGDGWFDLLLNLTKNLEPLGVRAVQVKEKFGSLRFYLEAYSEECHSFIESAVQASLETCEQCGEPGRLCGESWLQTLCPECAAVQGY